MRQTVTGRFRTWDDARHAQDVLLNQGFAAGDIELPAHTPGVLAGLERLVASFFATAHRAREGVGERVGSAPHAPGDMVLLAVHVTDDAHAELACATLGAEHAVEVAMRHDAWHWAMPDDTATRERSALDELGLAELATAVWRRTMTQPQADHAPEHAPQGPGPAGGAASSGQPAGAGESAESAVLAAASAPGAGAIMGHAVEVPGAPVATQPAKDVAPQIPDEFLEYEDDTPAHHRTLH
jgi:hypothetical protein